MSETLSLVYMKDARRLIIGEGVARAFLEKFYSRIHLIPSPVQPPILIAVLPKIKPGIILLTMTKQVTAIRTI